MTSRTLHTVSIVTEAQKLFEIIRITMRSRARYIWDLLGSTLFLSVVMFVFVRLWTVTYQSGSGGKTSSVEIAGFSLAQMIWYLVATEAIIMSMVPIHRNIEREIREGDVAVRLNKPYSFLGYHGSVFIGEGLLKVGVLIGVGGLVALLAVGPIGFSPLAIFPLMITFIMTATLNFLYGALIGLLAFWTEDITGFFFIFDRVKWLLGGFLMPITLFPQWLQDIVGYLPFSLMIYRPASLAVKFEWQAWAQLALSQLGLIAVLSLIASLIYRLGVRRLDVNGG